MLMRRPEPAAKQISYSTPFISQQIKQIVVRLLSNMSVIYYVEV